MSTQSQDPQAKALQEPAVKEAGTKSVAPPGPAPTPQDGGSGNAPVPAAPRPAAPTRFRVSSSLRKWLLLAALAVAGVAAYLGWLWLQPPKLPPGFASSNGRIEATEIDVAAKLAGRIIDELVDEGDEVTAGQVVAHMEVDVLQAQRLEAEGKHREAKSAVEAANKTVEQRKNEKEAAQAVVRQRAAELDLAKKKLVRAENLVKRGGMSQEDVDIRLADQASAEAALSKAKADVAAAEAAIATAEAVVIREQASVKATQATIERYQADIDQSTLKAPRESRVQDRVSQPGAGGHGHADSLAFRGRVQYRVHQPDEMLDAGGKVLNLIDLNDVYMTFFLPTDWAGKVKLGAEVRLVLDAAPQFVIPAKVTFVADVAQFTPKTVETAVERQKLTFRIKAHIPPEVLRKYVRDVKTGLPGVAYVQLDPQAQWPTRLEVKLPQ
jgi:HlyD family secretion protein